jgi:hypothetical protein
MKGLEVHMTQDWQVGHMTCFTRTYKHCPFNMNIVKIIYGISMKHQFGLAIIKCKNFDLEKIHIKFITPFLVLWNGWKYIVL